MFTTCWSSFHETSGSLLTNSRKSQLGISRHSSGWTLDRIETRLTRDAGEGKINSIDLELLLGGDLSDEQRQRLVEIASRCPIHRTLTEGVTITHR